MGGGGMREVKTAGEGEGPAFTPGPLFKRKALGWNGSRPGGKGHTSSATVVAALLVGVYDDDSSLGTEAPMKGPSGSASSPRSMIWCSCVVWCGVVRCSKDACGCGEESRRAAYLDPKHLVRQREHNLQVVDDRAVLRHQHLEDCAHSQPEPERLRQVALEVRAARELLLWEGVGCCVGGCGWVCVCNTLRCSMRFARVSISSGSRPNQWHDRMM